MEVVHAPTPPARPVDDPARLAQLLDQLSAAWTEQARAHDQLQRLESRRQLVQAEAEHYQHAQAGYVREHLELAYASTVHGAQGDTTTTAHMSVVEQTTAASAYVGMTRGRETNVAHLVADSIADAREQWIATFDRDRADLGPAHAAEQAARDAANYATYDELIARDKVNLDITWLRDESLEDADNLPAPEFIAREIVEDLTAALAEFEAVAAALEARVAEPAPDLHDEQESRRL